jgi:hypothetical protein
MIPRKLRLAMLNWLGAGYIRFEHNDVLVEVKTRHGLAEDSDGHPDMEKSIRFAVLPARGGCVMETRTYDRKEREWDVVSHVIPDGADVAKQVGDIVAMELLRH